VKGGLLVNRRNKKWRAIRGRYSRMEKLLKGRKIGGGGCRRKEKGSAVERREGKGGAGK